MNKPIRPILVIALLLMFGLAILNTNAQVLYSDAYAASITNEANGIEPGDMHKLLLEKVEELTLYILDHEERILGQNKEIQSLRPWKKNISIGKTFKIKSLIFLG